MLGVRVSGTLAGEAAPMFRDAIERGDAATAADRAALSVRKGRADFSPRADFQRAHAACVAGHAHVAIDRRCSLGDWPEARDPRGRGGRLDRRPSGLFSAQHPCFSGADRYHREGAR
jgi:hypothetical protein